MPDDQDIIVERDGHVLTVTLNRPEAKNAFSPSMLVGAADAWKLLDEDDELRVGILTGAGGDFCSGMDLKALSKGVDPDDAQRMSEGPVATIRIPVRLKYGIHGNWVPAGG